ncbi:MAG: MFS transporter [Halobacteriovoraceae bacterium]|nr:MFS transporter [Halobacteriovoraceae bacterium]
MKEITRLKLLFAILYFVQGGVISYFSLFQKPYLNKLGVARENIGLLTTLLLLPFVLKVGFGFVSDRFPHRKMGKRKPYMILGLSLASLSFFGASFFTPDKAFLLYCSLVLCASFCVALFDAATDGLAIDKVPENEQGPVQSYMVGGKALGVILLSLSIGQLVEFQGYQAVFFSMGAILIIPLILTCFINTNAPESSEECIQTEKRKLKDTPFWLLAFFGISYSFVSFGSDGLVSLYLSDVYGLTEKSVGLYGSLRGTGAIIGSILAGFILVKMNPSKVNYLALILVFLGVLMLGHILSDKTFTPVAMAWGAIWAFQEVCFLALVMNLLRGTFSAFGFASLMAMGNLGTAIGEGVATSLTATMDFPKVFTILAVGIVIPIFLLKKIHSHPLWSKN